MTPEALLAARTARLPQDLEPPDDDDRSLLLELASDLQSWTAQNPVFRQALDRTAQRLTELADQAEPA